MELVGELASEQHGRFFSWEDMPPLGSANYGSHGKGMTSIAHGKLYQDVAANIIANNYADVTKLTMIFAVTVHTSSEGDTSYGAGAPTDHKLLEAYAALKNNYTIRFIGFDHLKHTKKTLESLLSAIANNPHLPLDQLVLNSIVPKPKLTRHSPPDEGWMLSLLSKYLGQILRTHSAITRLSLSSNRLGLSENIDDHLSSIGNAIETCQSLHYVDLSNNMFTFQHSMKLLELLANNTSIISLSLTCRGMLRSEKKTLEAALRMFLQKNQTIRDNLFNAITQGDVNAVRTQIEQGASLFYLHGNMHILAFADVIMKQTRESSQKLDGKLKSRIRFKSKDAERSEIIAQNEIRLGNLEEIKRYLNSKFEDLKKSSHLASANNRAEINESSIEEEDGLVEVKNVGIY